MTSETIDWIVSELREAQDENVMLKQELETLKSGIVKAILEPKEHDANGNHLTGSQIKDQQLKAIASLIFPEKIRPFMGLFSETENELDQLKIGFTT